MAKHIKINQNILYFVAGLAVALVVISVFVPSAGLVSNLTSGVTGHKLNTIFEEMITPQTAMECTVAGGSWFATPDKIGCFGIDMDIGMECSGADYTEFKGMCEGAGATMLCDQHNIGCYYG